MGIEKYLLLFLSLAALLYDGNGCQIDGVTNWLFIVNAEMYDYHQGTFWSRTATNIAGITNFSPGGGVNSQQYISAALQDGNVTLTTTANYPQYEENETSDTMSFSLTFSCTDGSTNLLTFEIKVIDTNNNDPIFLPDDNYEFTVLPPLPPGFEITGCGQDIVVRDIDLTTTSIIFSIEENPYLEVVYEGRSPVEYKQFLASLRTKDLIRTLPEDVELTISATDVDQTGDPPRTTYATIRLKADEEFQFPEEPIFSQPLYLATYVNDEVILQQPISLQQGFDEEVAFSLDEEQLLDPSLANYFGLTVTGNQVFISVTSLPDEIVRSRQVILVIRADRQYTSGDTATVIIQFPEVPTLEFEEALYTGTIVDNSLQPLQLSLKQGYEEGFSVSLQGEYASFFSTTIQGNTITLSMTALEANVLEENNFLTLQVVASNAHGSSTAVVSLDIIKDDTVTPLFEKPIYIGEYTAETGLTVELITLVQGYDENVSFSLQGDHAVFFQLTHDGATVTVTSSYIPVEMWTRNHILLIVSASKPRTITSTTTLYVSLPPARELTFGAPVFSGTLRDSTVTHPVISLSTGYDEDVNFALDGEYASYFSLSTTQDQVSVNLPTALPDDVISQNRFLALTLQATGTHTLPASTTLVLEILKPDLQTPVFTENVYKGTFDNNNLELGSIGLIQGYDSTVTFRLQGEHSQYFRLDNVENNVTLELESEIPADVMFSEKLLVFSVLADKPFTVGANAAVSIAFSDELTDAAVMGFSQNTYVGYLENNELFLDNIVLQTGFEEPTEFTLIGEFVSYFSFNNTENVVTISLANALTEEIIANNKFILLEINAERERAVPVTTSVVIDIKVKEIEAPVFSKPYYVTVYSNGTFEEKLISLSHGYDDTVSYALDGENSVWFKLTQSGEDVVLSLDLTDGSIPDEILESNNFFLFTILAHKPGTTSAKAAVFVDIPKEIPKPVIVQFTQSSYVGRIENEEVYAPIVTLLGEQQPVDFILTGDFAQYFEIAQTTPTDIQIQLSNGLPENIEELPFIILDIEAQYPEAISGYTSIVLEVVKQPEVITPVFEEAYYTGEFSEQELLFHQSIRLIQGFDESVVFTLAGDDAQFFELIQTENNTLTLAANNELEQIKDSSYLTFSIVANKANSVPGMAAIIIGLPEFSTVTPLRFAQNIYRGSIENGSLSIHDILLEEGYSPDMNVNFTGDYMAYFQLTNQEGIFTLQLTSDLPVEILDANNILVLTIEVQLGDFSTHTTVILDIIKSEVSSLAFEEAYYVGWYSIIGGFTFDPQITLTGGYDETVSFSLEGEGSQWFGILEDEYPITLTQNSPIPNDIVSNNQQLIFVIVGEKPENVVARSTIIVIIDGNHDDLYLSFDQLAYLGSIENDIVSLQPIALSEGYTEDVSFILHGELENYFNLSLDDEKVTISLKESFPEELIPENGLIILELQATAPHTLPASATIILQMKQEQIPTLQQLVFDATYYTGYYSELEGLNFEKIINLSEGYDEYVQFTLEGDDAQYFEAVTSDNSVTLRQISAIPVAIMSTNHLIFTIRAERTNAVTSRATIIISLKDDRTENMVVLGFARVSYSGSIENNTVTTDTIVLSEGYSELVTFTLFGDLADYFTMTSSETVVEIYLSTQIPEVLLPLNRIIILELQAAAPQAIPAYTTLVIEMMLHEDTDEMMFSSLYYTGEYSRDHGLNMSETISLALGYDETVEFSLRGDQSQWFQIETSGNTVILSMNSSIPNEILENHNKLIFFIFAEKSSRSASAVIVISLIDGDETSSNVSFDKVLFEGTIEDGVVTHEAITVNEYDGSEIEIFGDNSELFSASVTDGVVTVQSDGSLTLPATTTYVALELRAGAASAVLLLNVIQTGEILEIAFDKSLYQGRVEDGVVTHEVITLTGYEGSSIQLEGNFAELFTAIVTDGEVIVQSTGSVTLPATLTFVALELNAGDTNTVLILEVIYFGEIPEVAFDKTLYQGSVEDGGVAHETISITGYDESEILLDGEYSDFFTASITNGTVTVQGTGSLTLPTTLTFVALELRAGSGSAVLLLDVIHSGSGEQPELSFDKTLYQGNTEDGVVTHEPIALTGYSGSSIQLTGEYSAIFTATVSDGVVTVQSTASVTLPATLAFVALELRAGDANAVLLLEVIHTGEITEVNFDKSLYQGRVEDGVVTHETISLTGYDGSDVLLDGDYSDLFTASITNGIVTVQGTGSLTLPTTLTFVALELRAGSGSAVLLLDVIHSVELPGLAFDQTLYQGRVEEGVVEHETITLTGYFESSIQLAGEYSELFTATVSDGVVTVQNTESVTLPATLTFIALELGAGEAKAVLLLEVIHSGELPEVTFDKTLYQGKLEENVVTHEIIILTGYSGFSIQLEGEYSALFTATVSDGVVTVHNTGSVTLPATIAFMALELEAGSAKAVLLLEVIHTGEIPEVTFDKTFYQGSVEDGDVTHETISITGFHESNIILDGDYSNLFTASITNGVITVQGTESLALPSTLTFVTLELRAGSASAVLLLNVVHSGELPGVAFDKTLYQGRVEGGVVTHETIILTGFSGSSIQLQGEYSALFTTSVSNEVVTVTSSGSVTLPASLTFVALELGAGNASAVLLLEVTHNETPVPPTVTFSSVSYNLRVDVTQTGMIGRVEASADNGEDVTYSLSVQDPHLLQRISISNDGELYLSAPANSGAYNFQVIATTVFSDATGTATAHLTVEAITSCGDDNYVLPPLQIFDRDEESSHSLISFNQEEFPGCRYTLSNRWPIDQQWLYVDETGLHTLSIDREHASIAFMALSQVQVELTLECDSDGDNIRTKRAVEAQRIDQLDHLGPYDYGPYKWILTDSNLHDSRKSLVNLIVNDINDNYPIFLGVENQPVTVGWPVADLEERIVPRYLVEVKATDADIGENAALVYWSNEEVLAVSPTTGLVHVRNNAQLEDNLLLTVYATDRNGEGLTGSIELLVKLIDTSHIAVVTVRNAFLIDEENILSNLSASVGYEVKALRVTVVTDTVSEETNSRKKREAIISTGTSVQLYVYGLIQREPVEVKQLTEDINSIPGDIETVIIASTVSLEDHLETLAICPLPGRDTGLLVSTIVLAVLLFILIIVAAVWFFLKWRKEKNYEQFSDVNSLASRNDSLKLTPKPENTLKPRINIEELKRSERRLQEMLDAPITEVTVEQTSPKVTERTIEAKVNMPEPPLVIQSIDKLKAVDDDSEDEDEFGERKKARRKSVVTFNENVERIIHVEDPPNDDDTDFEIYRL